MAPQLLFLITFSWVYSLDKWARTVLQTHFGSLQGPNIILIEAYSEKFQHINSA